MPLTPVEFPRFGGLDLTLDPQEEGFIGAVDAMDAMFDWPGRVRARDGARFVRNNLIPAGARALAMKYTYMSPGAGGATEIVVLSNNGTNLQLSGDTSGLIRTVAVGTSSSAAWFAEVGTPTQTYLAYTSENANATYANAATTLTASYGGGPLTVTPKDNRLVICKGSRVRFSAAGDPTTYGANDYVDLYPGDGEFISAACVYRDMLFVFKQTKFFVFTAASTDSSGQPVFNYRTVNVGHGAITYNAAVAAPEGVYFMDGTGVWLTAGETPRKVSDRIDPLLALAGLSAIPDDLPYISTGLFNMFAHQSSYQLAAADDYLLLTMVAPTSSGVVALHRPTQTWTAWSIAPDALCGVPIALSRSLDGPSQIAYVKYNTRELYAIQKGQDADQNNAGASAPVVARWRSGMWNPAAAGAEANVFEWLIDTKTSATGLTLGVIINDGQSNTSFPVAAQGSFGQARVMQAIFGRDLSVQVSGFQPWSVSRITANLSGQTNPGFEAA